MSLPYADRVPQLSLRRRVGMIAAVGVGLLAVVISVAAYVTVRVSLWHQMDSNLLNRAHAAVSSPLSDADILARIPSDALGAADVRIGLLPALGRGVSSQGQASAPPAGQPERAVARGLAEESVRTTIGPDGQAYRVVAVPATDNVALVLAQPTADTQKVLRLLGLVLFVVGGAGVVLAAWAGLGIARTGLRPVVRLTAAAEHVARTGELRPVPVQGNDELARLAHAFNAMLAALSEARGRERRLVADAGHELRTPLTSLRTNLDLLAQSENRPGLSPEDRAALLRDVRAQVVEMSALVGDLVELAREDSPATAHAPVDLADLTGEAVERVRRRAPNVRFELEVRPWATYGDAQALERAVTNLLDNAAKWSPPRGVVNVTLRDGVLSVADQGPGIAEADLPHVFDRFYRSPEARTMPGSGLGLAIVKQAADRHGGTVSAGRAPGGGALLSLRLPGMPTSMPPTSTPPPTSTQPPTSTPPTPPPGSPGTPGARGEQPGRRVSS